MRHGKRARGPVIHFIARANDLPYSRVGYAVRRRVGSAVTRNLIKRRLRTIIHDLPINPGFDIVATPQPASVNASYRDLVRETKRTTNKLRLIEQSAFENYSHQR